MTPPDLEPPARGSICIEAVGSAPHDKIEPWRVILDDDRVGQDPIKAVERNQVGNIDMQALPSQACDVLMRLWLRMIAAAVPGSTGFGIGVASFGRPDLKTTLLRMRGGMEALLLVGRLLEQTPKSQNKIHALHGHDVGCISNGKARIRYERGTKASLATAVFLAAPVTIIPWRLRWSRSPS